MKSIMLSTAMLLCQVALAGRASFKVLVVDSATGTPIPGIKIEGSFLNYARGWGIPAKDNDVDAWTDSNGRARLSGDTEKGVGGYRIYNAEGYYNAEWTEIEFREKSILRLGAWVPNDIVSTARLDRIVKPIPLYVKRGYGEHRERSRDYYEVCAWKRDLSATNDVPIVKGAELAYDFVKGAFLPPVGNGEIADIRFVFNETVHGWKKYKGYDGVAMMKLYKMDVSIMMPGEGNGLLEFRPDQNAGIKLRTAPAEGYAHCVSRWFGRFGGGDGDKTDCDGNRCYAFRIRTVYDESGKIKSAYYGKIYGDFNLSKREGVSFLYYLNPTPLDRNLEWDRKNNLCPKPGDIGVPRP